MKIIDAHTHTNFGYKQAVAFAQENNIDFSLKGLQQSLKQNSVEAVIAITTNHHAPTPGEHELLIQQNKQDQRLKPVCSINPDNVSPKDVAAVEHLFKANRIVGIKIFPGYHPVAPDDPRYFPFYELAGKYDKPVIIHTGDTFGSHYRVKFAHPLAVDDIAVQFRQTTFVIAHLGNPWVRDATELVYKNENVYADLSAFCIGCAHKTPRFVKEDIAYAFEASGRPDKFMYGSDWPLVDMTAYIKIVKQAVPKEHHKKVFYDNAKKVFKL